jgi:hypothetical protein
MCKSHSKLPRLILCKHHSFQIPITEVHPTDEMKFQIVSDTADWPLYKDPYLPVL